MNENDDSKSLKNFEDLDALFGMEDETTKKSEKITLSQNLTGFASCFPDWDVHPPVKS